MLKNVLSSLQLPTLPPPPSLDSRLTSQDDDIMRTLLVHEKKPTNQRFSGIAHAPDGGSDTDTSSSDSDDDRSAAKAIMDPMLQGFGKIELGLPEILINH